MAETKQTRERTMPNSRPKDKVVESKVIKKEAAGTNGKAPDSFDAARASAKLKHFLEKEKLTLQPYFNCVNQEVLKSFEASRFMEWNLVSPAIKIERLK